MIISYLSIHLQDTENELGIFDLSLSGPCVAVPTPNETADTVVKVLINHGIQVGIRVIEYNRILN